MELRTRDLGEIFERAIAAYVQNFPVLLGLIVAATIPLALLQYPINEIQQPQLDALLRLLEHPEIARTAPVPPVLTSPSFLGATILLTLRDISRGLFRSVRSQWPSSAFTPEKA